MNATSRILKTNNDVADHLKSDDGRHVARLRTGPSSREDVSAQTLQTYGQAKLPLRYKIGCKLGIVALLTALPQLAQAEVLRPIDLRIEIERELYSSLLCQKIVRLHEDRDFAPWGMVFSRPSHFCSFPGEVSKSYTQVMWRLLVSQTSTHLSFVLCRPVFTTNKRSEQCDWRVDIKKPKNVNSLLNDDDFLFKMVAALHEKLPLRSFYEHGRFYTRSEPRVKSPFLENPPSVVRGKVHFEEGTGRLVISPISSFLESGAFETGWLVPAESMEKRIIALENSLRDAGFEPTDPPQQEPNAQNPAFMPPAPIAPSKSESIRPLRREFSESDKMNPSRQKAPLKVSELPAAPDTGTKSNRKGKLKISDGKKSSVFAHDVLIAPDDTEVVKLKGAESDIPTVPSEQLFLSLWNALWPGRWHTSFDISGLPVPESERSRLPSVQSFSFSGWHPIWREVSLGGQIRHTREDEVLDLKISLPGSALYQEARGSRKTTLISSTLLEESNLAQYRTQFELKAGFVYLNEAWTYDRRKSTFEIWSPAGRGRHFDASLRLQPQRTSDGPTALASFGYFIFDAAAGSQWALESGWQWALDDSWNKWWQLRFSTLQGYLSLKRGRIHNTGGTILEDGTGVLLLNSFSLGLRLNVDETESP